MGIGITGEIPNADDFETEHEKKSFLTALDYMQLKPGQKIIGQKIDYVFLGSCTNSRIEDYRLIANIVKGKKKPKHLTVLVVPGSVQVEKQLKEEGLDQIFRNAGFDVRGPGCSSCLGMNEDKIPSGKYCVSTSNRNFQGRQGPGARTLLASPLTAAVCAVTGVVTDVREFI
jgi:3-isopropylmalate/(R)-2-methylmalate dehydratase large subunit